MSRVLSLRLKDDQMERLKRLARRSGHAPSKLAATLLEEALRMEEFGYVEFRNTLVGRQAYVKGSRVAVWQVLSLARGLDHDSARVAEYLQWPEVKVRAAFAYAKAFPEEINEAIAENDAIDETKLRQLLPQLEVFTVRLDESDAVPEQGPEQIVRAGHGVEAPAR